MTKKLPRLTPRLELAASFVRRGATVADIGTDHAYLPVFLVNSGLCPFAVASDIAPGPLDSAKKTALIYGAGSKVSFRLADGLNGVGQKDADDIVIAGMGGELISKIIGSCGWLKSGGKHLVLQPMTAQEDLRIFLLGSGFKIEKEAVASEKGGRKLYVVMSVYYSGENCKVDTLYSIAGELTGVHGKNERAYIMAKARALIKKADGLAKSKADCGDEAEKARALAKRLLEISENMI